MPTPATKINFSLTPLPNTQFEGDLSQALQLLVSHLTGSLDSGAFVGQIGGSEPLSNIGLWLDNNTIKNWSSVDGRYLPLPVVAGALSGANLYTTSLISGAKSANIELFLPDQNGATLATLADVPSLAGAIATVTAAAVSGGTISFDWTAIKNGGNLYVTLSGAFGAVTISEANSPTDSQREDLWIEQSASGTATPFTITWPATWQISSGAVLTNRAASNRIIDHFIVRRVGTQTFVEQGKSWGVPTSGGGSDTTPPIVSSITATVNQTTVVVQFNESLQGMTLDSTKWSVKKNGNTNAVSSAIATSTFVVLTVANSYGSNATGTVQYSGTDVKDIAGNAAASFGPSAITINSAGGSGGGGGHLDP